MRDFLERVSDKGIVIDPRSQMALLDEEPPGSRIWVVEDESLPLLFGQTIRLR